MPIIHIPEQYQMFTGGHRYFETEQQTLRGALLELSRAYPELIGKVLSDTGELMPFVCAVADGQPLNVNDAISWNLLADTSITLLSAIAGS